MKKQLALLTLAFALAATPAFAKQVKVVATFSVIGDMVKEIGGDKVSLTVLVGPDGDAHTFEPSPADAKTLTDADLLVVNGLNLESWLPKLAAASDTKARFVTASFGVVPRNMNEDGREITDPHAWQSLSNGAIYVRNIEEALKQVDPDDAATFTANADKLLAELAELDQWTRQEIATVPSEKRKVITTHDAFGYFGAAYGVTFMAPEGISTDAEPSAQGLAKLTDQIKAEHIKALFIENMTDPRLMKTIARETGAEMGGELFSDALSPLDGPAPTYPDMFRNNVPKLVAAMLKN